MYLYTHNNMYVLYINIVRVANLNMAHAAIGHNTCDIIILIAFRRQTTEFNLLTISEKHIAQN